MSTTIEAPTPQKPSKPKRTLHKKALVWYIFPLGIVACGVYAYVGGTGGQITEKAKSFAPANSASGNDGYQISPEEQKANDAAAQQAADDAAATLHLDLGGSVDQSIEGITPGKDQFFSLNVKNPGAAVQGFTLKTSAKDPASVTGLTLTAQTCDTVPMRVNDQLVCAGNAANFNPITDLSAGTLEISGTVEAGQEQHLILQLRVPSDAATSVSGSRADLTYTVTSAAGNS